MEAVRNDRATRTIEIPAKWWPDNEEMFMNKVGSAIIIMPKRKIREAMQDALSAFTPDLFEDGRPEQWETQPDDVHA